MDDRDWMPRFVASQSAELDAIFGLTGGEELAQTEFLELSLVTAKALSVVGERPFAPYFIDPNSGFSFCCQQWLHPKVPAELVERWQRWASNYPSLAARNPRLELRDAMQDCSEDHDASSFPYGWEDLLWEWVDRGDPDAPPPFHSTPWTSSLEFYANLRRLWEAMDGGWLMWDEAVGRVIYVDVANWAAIRAERKTQREAGRREVEAGAARDPEFAAMLAKAKQRMGKG